MKDCFVRLIKLEIAAAFSLFLFAGCASTSSQPEHGKLTKGAPGESGLTGAWDAEFKRMDAKKDPRRYINDMRDYALNNLNNLTDGECDLIKKTIPKIHENKNTMEFCYYWILPDNGGVLEVVATPPPDPDPIAAFRRDRVYYP